MWASPVLALHQPYTWVNSGGLGTMGFSVPAAIGAKVGMPDRMVWAVDGDGCFQMTAQELVTATAERIPIKVAILNNAYLGMVRQWQEMFYDERYSEVYLSPDLPDYVKWAEAMGCVAIPGRVARRGRSRHREGERHQRPSGRDRVPHRRRREGVPHGSRRPVEQRHRGRIELVSVFGGRIVDVGHDELTVSVDDVPSRLDDLEDLLSPFGIAMMQRTGRIALPKLDRTSGLGS
jgi:hypothetical protein